MERPSRFEEHRYVGDKRTVIVHDLDHATPADTIPGCDIPELIASERYLAFGPDTLAEARNRGYRPCPFCIPSDEAREITS